MKAFKSLLLSVTLALSVLGASWFFIPNSASTFSLQTNGSTQWVTTSDASSLQITNNFSVNVWVKNTSPGSPGAYIAKGESHSGSSNFGWAFSSQNGCSATGCYEIIFTQDCNIGGSQLLWIGSSTAVNDGNWHMLTATFASGVGKIYKDSVIDPSPQTIINNGITTICIATGVGVSVGGRFTNSSIFWAYNGKNYWPAVWNVVLAQAAITVLYGGGTPHDPRVNSGSYTAAANLALFFPYLTPPDTNTGTIFDGSGNSNNGTPHATPTFAADVP